jgi:CDP-diacylglycerol--glycerol-3-phosphate 3-phosphatidyltransferase
MILNIPNLLTLLRIIIIPVLVGVYFWENQLSGLLSVCLFTLAGITDALDGYLARKWGQQSAFGAFLDPVADKLIVATALILLAADPVIQSYVYSAPIFTIVVMVIIGREIAVSALREWMASLGERTNVAVSSVGKVKTTFQIIAIGFLLYRQDLFGLPIVSIGELLLFLAAALTIWSMSIYLRAAWPSLSRSHD